MLVRLHDPLRIFELIGYAKVVTSAEEAQKLGLLHRADPVSMNPERLIFDAKALALSLVPNYAPGAPRSDIKVAGESAYAMMKLGAWSARQGHFISDYDMIVAEKLAHVLSGGRLSGIAERFRAVSAGSGTRGFPEPVRQPEDAGAHAVYAEDGQTAPKLKL